MIRANAIAVDADGDFYVVGGTIDSGFPVTAGAFQKLNNGMFFNNGVYLNNALFGAVALVLLTPA